jgi:hypothetical protein
MLPRSAVKYVIYLDCIHMLLIFTVTITMLYLKILTPYNRSCVLAEITWYEISNN